MQQHKFHSDGNLILLRTYFTSLTATIRFHSKLNQRNTDVLIGPLRSIKGHKGRLEVTKVAMETVLLRVIQTVIASLPKIRLCSSMFSL